MATIRPDVDPSTIRPFSEQQVFRALRDQLPEDFLVVHSSSSADLCNSQDEVNGFLTPYCSESVCYFSSDLV